MLDRYWYGSASRISPEAPVPVVRIDREEYRAGGAANVALNVAELGARAHVIGLAGEDASAQALLARLQARGVRCQFITVPGGQTVTKLRVVSRNQQLIRLDFEDLSSPVHGLDVAQATQACLADAGVIVLSDYAKGTLSDPAALIRLARQHNVPVVVDPKGANFEPYRGASVITPNLLEFEAVVGRCPDEATLVERGESLRDALGLQALLITRSERGMTLLERGLAPLHLPALAREVYDVTGAGDTVVALLATCLAAGVPLASATTIANLGAGVVVGKLGTSTVSRDELSGALHSVLSPRRGILDPQQLDQAVAQARAKGERVAVCAAAFDGVGATELRAIQTCRARADRVVAAVISRGNESLRLPERLALAAALQEVDWITQCDADPQALADQLGASLVAQEPAA
jgi:D-beta-D-heptose 7-phosphate kinase/D-beta-D-heptose 1-phosphate adenosyltransferase